MSASNSIQNNDLNKILSGVSGGIVSAIQSASARTGVDFAYLVQQAGAESSFNPHAQAKTSSASGLYQFIESTWMSMVERYGDKHGIETAGKSKSDILAMRKDPMKAAAMAAEFASENEKFLNNHWGGEVGATELYFAHFLGAGQAASFLQARDDNGLQPAADLFPAAAKANKNVFFDHNTGRAKSLNEVYAFFDQKFSVDGSSQGHVQTASSHTGQTSYTPYKPSHAMLSSARTNSLGAWHNLVMNPLEIILLTQMDVPTKSLF